MKKDESDTNAEENTSEVPTSNVQRPASQYIQNSDQTSMTRKNKK